MFKKLDYRALKAGTKLFGFQSFTKMKNITGKRIFLRHGYWKILENVIWIG